MTLDFVTQVQPIARERERDTRIPEMERFHKGQGGFHRNWRILSELGNKKGRE